MADGGTRFSIGLEEEYLLVDPGTRPSPTGSRRSPWPAARSASADG